MGRGVGTARTALSTATTFMDLRSRLSQGWGEGVKPARPRRRETALRWVGLRRQAPNLGRTLVVMVSAETLTDGMRETMERVFRAPVVNRYGTRETGGIACECRHRRGLHVTVLTHHVEVVRPDGRAAAPGEVGDLVITLLTNYSMPLIRYRIGDRGAFVADGAPCPCGRTMPRLATVAARSTRLSGRTVAGYTAST